MAATNNRSLEIASIGLLLAASALILLHIRRQRDERRNHSKSRSIRPKVFKNTSQNDETSYPNNLNLTTDLPPHILRQISKEQKRQSKMEFLSMKSPMYDNVFMLDPEGNVMCTISLKKARWYVKKGIAEWTTSTVNNKSISNTSKENQTPQENHKYIRLLFQPNGQSTASSAKTTSELLYLRTPKQNICVSCGSPGLHMRHYIVPYSYRTLFPQHYKSHMSHDIVILCPDCHVNVDRETKKRMNRIEEELRDELNKSGERDYWCLPVMDDTYLYHVRSCALALVKWRERMPMETVASHEAVVREYLSSVDDTSDNNATKSETDENVPLTKSQLQKACGINYRIKNPEYIPGSELVVQNLIGDDDKFEQFIKEWRRHFMDTVRPRFMPRGWSVEIRWFAGELPYI